MKIAHFTFTFLPTLGGAQIVVHNLAVRQCADHNVTVVTSWKSFCATRSRVPYKVQPLLPGSQRLAWKSAGSPMALNHISWQLWLLQRMHKFDVWHVHYAYPAGYLALKGLCGGEPGTVLTCHGDDIQERAAELDSPFNTVDIRNAVRESVRGFPLVTAVSHAVRERYLQLGVQPECIHAIPNGLDLDRFNTTELDVNSTRSRLGVSPDSRLILTVGRNSPVKGYTSIPEILKILADKHRDIAWIIVGGGSETVMEWARAAGVSAYVRAVPETGPESTANNVGELPPDDLIALYKSADLLVSTSYMESFGCAVLEGMAAGLPIVATDVPGHRELVKDGHNGFLVPIDNPRIMAERIAMILDDSSLAGRLSAAGRVTASGFGWANVTDMYTGVYKKSRLRQTG